MLFTNIVHRVDTAPNSRQSLTFQWGEAQRLGLPTTSLISYPALFDAETMNEVERQCQPGDELGLHFHNLQCPRVRERYGVREPVLWLWPRAERIALIDEMVAAFTERFGHPPKSVGGYIIDAWTLDAMQTHHPSIKTAITSCFEEGVKMFYGNNRNWLLFSDGGPWNPYFPAKANALIPAKDSNEAIDIVALPHLNRDMIMALSSRDDWFASHPGNIFRARINDGPESPYFFRFLKAWERQAALNGWSYLNLFVSSPWLSGKHWCIEREEDVRALYTATLEHLKARDEAGANQNLTMDAFGKAFRERVAPGTATICHWKDEIKESKREVVWTVNPHHRCAFDMARGGALVDFRPYDGRLDGNLGPESPALWNGNYPFLVSAEHCGGHWNTSHHGAITDGTHTLDLCDRRFRVRIETMGDGAWRIHSGPVQYTLGGHALTIETTWETGGGSNILIRRRLLEYAGDASSLRLHENFLGRPGTHEYPEDLRGIVLRASDHNMPFAYSGQSCALDAPAWVGADVPRLGIHLRLSARTPALTGELLDGFLFKPVFHLRLTHPLHLNEEIVTCLETHPLANP